jgi:hypothetical protein
MSTAIQQYDNSPIEGLTQWEAPAKVLAAAQQAAKELQKVLADKKTPVMFNGEQYLEFEDWQTVGKFYGCTTKVESTGYVEYGGVTGFEATAVVLDRNQNVVGRAESMCMSDEDNWGDVPYYKWEDVLDESGKKIWIEGKNGRKGYYKSEKIQVGTKPKPLFQLRSMAQTRAQAKALRSVFSWVVVLAGYKTTPAEELTGQENVEDAQPQREPVKTPQRASEKGQQVGVSGKIKSGRLGNDGSLWIDLDGKSLVVIDKAHVNDKLKQQIVPGAFLKVMAIARHNDKIGDFYSATTLIELWPPEGVVEAKREDPPLAEDLRETADELSDLFDRGEITTAASLPPGKKPGTIGTKRAQRLYTLMTQNKDKNNGFSEAEAKKILATLPVPIEHLRDLESGLEQQFEDWATGKDDYRAYWEKE